MNRLISSMVSVLAGTFLFLLPVAPLAAQLQDQIYLYGRTEAQYLKVIIDEISPTIVTYRYNGVSQEKSVNEIKKIKFADEPSRLNSIRLNILDKMYDQAQVSLDMINISDQGNLWVRQDILFLTALLASRKDKTEGGRLLNDFIENQKNSYRYYEAVELFGNLAASVGAFDKAAESFREVGKAPWPEYKNRAAVLEAGALVGSGDHAAALTRYEGVAALDPSNEQMRTLIAHALAGKARCLGATGKADQGLVLAEKIIKDNDPKTRQKVMAQAYNAQGACYLAQKRPKDALIAYLHTSELFYQDRDTHAEALYQLSMLWEVVKKSGEANRVRDLLRERYGDSVWAKKL